MYLQNYMGSHDTQKKKIQALMGRCVIVFIGLNAILLILHTPHDPVASGSILSVKNF